MKKVSLFLSCTILLVVRDLAATYYVDSTATGANNGTSWANAWTDPNSVSAVGADAVVYISGGPSGSSQTYTLSGTYHQWGLKNGTAGHKITYQIGQDSSHNGTAILTPGAATNQIIFAPDYCVISGKLGDGSDGIHHIKFFANGLAGEGISASDTYDLTVEYLDFGSIHSIAGFNPVHGFIKLSHIKGVITGTDAGRAIYAFFDTATDYGQRALIEYSDIGICWDNVANDGFGADGLQWVGDGFDIHACHIYGIGEAGARGDHQDGWQGSGVHYVRIWDCQFEEIQNYGLFAELPQTGNTNTHVKFWNNTFTHHDGRGTQAIAIGGDSSGGKINTDVHAWNNTADGYDLPFTFRNPSSGSDASAFISCTMKNNLSVDNSGGGNIIDSAVSSASNINITAAQAATYLRSWTSSVSSSIDYRPTSAATSVVDQGVDGSSILPNVFDKTGTARPQGSAWDIGAYEYNDGGADTTPPTPSPSTIASVTATGTTTATIVATTAADAVSPPVQYAVSTDNGSAWSSWQSSATFNVTGLTPATTYQCKVKARDSATTPNETTASSASAVTTDSTPSSRPNPKARALTGGF